MIDDVVYIDTFYVLDFDRCIGDTGRLYRQLELAIEELTNISLDQLSRARQRVEASGGSFDTAAYVMGVLKESNSGVSWKVICERMIETSRNKDMLEPGASDLLERLKKQREYFGILTYGGEAWQRTKLLAARLESIPALIMDHPGKGEELAKWQQSDGLFKIPPDLSRGRYSLLAKTIVLVDDKAASFRGIPLGVKGFHVVWAEREKLPSQAGELPPHVVTTNGIFDLIDLLFSK